MEHFISPLKDLSNKIIIKIEFYMSTTYKKDRKILIYVCHFQFNAKRLNSDGKFVKVNVIFDSINIQQQIQYNRH